VTRGRRKWALSRLYDRGFKLLGPTCVLERDFDDVHGQLTGESLDYVYTDFHYNHVDRQQLRG